MSQQLTELAELDDNYIIFFDLVVGLYTLRIDFIDSGTNLNWFEPRQ